MAEKKEILKLSCINKCFGNVVVAKDISLTVISNQLHALIGPNGAGKTTLIKMISGELKPDQGVVTLLDRKVNHLSEIARVHRGCIRSFQVSSIIGSMTVFENILLAVKQKRSILKMLFRKFQSNSSESSFVYQTLNQLSLETLGTKVASTLSHGDKRKLELAMALAMGPKILLLDEPFSSLDLNLKRAPFRGLFFYSKKDIPAKPKTLIKFNFFFSIIFSKTFSGISYFF